MPSNLGRLMFGILKHCANRCNLVGHQLPLLDATYCIRLHTLLHVVGSCSTKFETGQNFEPTTPNIPFFPWLPKRSATMLDLFAQLFQNCWGHIWALHMVYKVLWAVSFPLCTAGPNTVGSCCVHYFAHSFTVMSQIIKTILLVNRIIIQVVLKRRRMHIAKIPMHLHQKTKRNLKYRKPVRELLRKTTSGWPFLCYLTMTGKLVGDCRIQWLGVFVLR